MALPPANTEPLLDPGSFMGAEPDGAPPVDPPSQPASRSVHTHFIPGSGNDNGQTMTLVQVAGRSRWEQVRGDLAGGLTSAIVALPQTITIGALAFAPLGQEYLTVGILAGFYCSIVSGLITAWTGTIALFVGSLLLILVTVTVAAIKRGQRSRRG